MGPVNAMPPPRGWSKIHSADEDIPLKCSWPSPGADQTSHARMVNATTRVMRTSCRKRVPAP